MNKGWVYILSTKNLSFYIGSTLDLNKRIEEHKRGLVRATKNLRPFNLAFCQEYPTIKEARKIEYKLKRLKRRDYIEAIVRDRVIKMTI